MGIEFLHHLGKWPQFEQIIFGDLFGFTAEKIDYLHTNPSVNLKNKILITNQQIDNRDCDYEQTAKKKVFVLYLHHRELTLTLPSSTITK